MSSKRFSYSLEPEIPESYMGNLLDFIYEKFLLPQSQRFVNISRTRTPRYSSLTFVVLDKSGNQILRAEVEGGKPLKLNFTVLNDAATEEEADQVRQDILIAAELFEEKVRGGSLFFAWREGEEIVPERVSGKENRSINRMFLETQILLFVVFITIGLLLFPILGWYAPITLMILQFVFVLFSPRLIERTADWHITKANPIIHLLEYTLPFEQLDGFKQKYPNERIVEIKKEVYEQTIAKKGDIDCETTGHILRKHGIECDSGNMSVKKVNVYDLVKKVADKFGFPMPRIVVSNTLVPNAAASGPSPSRGVVLITTGLFVQLKEEEILSVLGHEFGHLKGRDPLLLFGLMGSEFLFRFYVLLPLFPIVFSSVLLFFAYFWAVMTLLYFIAKFFEARADIVSAIYMGQPEVLANALEEIGFRRLLLERIPSYRIQEWISLDAHPPIYFRVNRLREFRTGVKVAYPLFQSAKDVIRGFLHSL